MEHYTLTKPIAEIWTSARAMITRLRGLIGAEQWPYALEALVCKLVLLEALALAPAAPKLPPIGCRSIMKLPAPPHERAKTYAFCLWPRAKPHPARIRLLGPAQSRAKLERLKLARQKRMPEAQRIVRRIGALRCVLEKPLRYAQRLARKFAKASKKFLAKIALKRQPARPMSISASNATPNNPSGPRRVLRMGSLIQAKTLASFRGSALRRTRNPGATAQLAALDSGPRSARPE